MQDPVICYCLGRRKSEIITAWRAGGFDDIKTFMNATKVGSICTSCQSTVRHLIENDDPAIPVASVPGRPPLYTLRNPPMTRVDKIKRWLKNIKNRYIDVGMKQMTFHMMYRLDGGWRTAVCALNAVNSDFPKNTADFTYRIRMFDADGALVYTGEGMLKCPGELTLDAGKLCRVPPHDRLFGFLEIQFKPLRRRDLLNARIGSLRPYVMLEHNGYTAVVHEKSVHFENGRVLPGAVSTASHTVHVFFANIDAAPNMVTFAWHTAQGAHQEKHALAPHAAAIVTVPEYVNGARVDSLSIQSEHPLSGFQYITNRTNPTFTLQHLVKEGD